MQTHDILLPSFISIHLRGGPAFATVLASSISGREIRAYDRQYSIQKYNLSGCKLSLEEFERFNCFFRARMGCAYAFRVRDYADYLIDEQVIAVGDGVSSQFEICKTYHDELSSYSRRIYAIREDSVSSNVEVDKIDKIYGFVHTKRPLEKGKELVIKAEFDVWVRFASDEFKYLFCDDGSVLIEELELLEVVND
ncbi:MAG: hypothetical protein RLZZ59_733 [Pseudomonadota bacterium]|jgi:uncharacterized protein (TIGR02217 family)